MTTQTTTDLTGMTNEQVVAEAARRLSCKPRPIRDALAKLFEEAITSNGPAIMKHLGDQINEVLNPGPQVDQLVRDDLRHRHDWPLDELPPRAKEDGA